MQKYIAQYEGNAEAELPRTLVELYKDAAALDDLIKSVAKKKEANIKAGQKKAPLSMSELRLALTNLLNALQNSQHALKQLRVGSDTRHQVPEGIGKLVTRMLRVTTDLANATIYADKEDRLSVNELVQSYNTSSPFADFTDKLESHIAQVKMRRASEHSSETKADPKVQKLAASYSKYYKSLPTSTKGLPFVAFRIPVSVLFADLGAHIEPQKLERAGFDVTLVGDNYTILEDQYLLAFDWKELGMDSGYRRLADGSIKIARKTGPKQNQHDVEANDKIMELLEGVNKKSGVKFAMASGKFVPNPRNPKLWLAWIVTEGQRGQLARAFRTTEVTWGLPFNAKDDE